jgi:hypothetical protein
VAKTHDFWDFLFRLTLVFGFLVCFYSWCLETFGGTKTPKHQLKKGTRNPKSGEG